MKASFRPASAEPINIDIINTQKRENRLLHKLSWPWRIRQSQDTGEYSNSKTKVVYEIVEEIVETTEIIYHVVPKDPENEVIKEQIKRYTISQIQTIVRRVERLCGDGMGTTAS